MIIFTAVYVLHKP